VSGGFGQGPIVGLQTHRRALERLWAGTGTAWRDGKRLEFEQRYVHHLLRTTSDMARELEVGAELISGALRSVGR
jgi:hypothetical protein